MDLGLNGSIALATNLSSHSSPIALAEDNHGFFSELLDAILTWRFAATMLAAMVAYDQFMYMYRKGAIAGPLFKIPFMGPFIQALYPRFDSYLAQWASGPLSCVSIFHKFVVLVSDRDLARKVFNSQAYVEPYLTPVAPDLLGPTAWVFLNGKAHVEYRKGLNGLFGREALTSYLPTQEKVLGEYFDKFVAATEENGGKPLPYFNLFREINCAVSCRTFVGHYISDEAVQRIADDYYCITAALELVSVPLSLYIPYSKQWLGKRAANVVLAEFKKCAAASKLHMAAGGKPTCIIDQWVASMVDSQTYRDRIAAGVTDAEKPSILVREFTDFEIAQTMFTFLFASQDASSSSTTYLFQVVAQRPDVLERIQQENLKARGGDKNGALGLEMLESMPYTNAVVKELLRYRPPVIFVPYIVNKAFPITPTYTVPKGTMVIPSCYPALHDPEVYPQPDNFNPERWISGNAKDQKKNWLVFGTGAHKCVAEQYVQLTMTAMIGKASLELDWVHHATKDSEVVKVFATLFPMDLCPLTFTRRD
ncbi:cytochrome P450 [Amylocarpus encephaloides]|uniref:sterol 22-desaturase n=1 Tax=Amylocarpus encephaloides TaxID=45428 RepID=A0A9P7YK58_9HELO|nr:cytochrome P450 [Amylocarpus encephaloides]